MEVGVYGLLIYDLDFGNTSPLATFFVLPMSICNEYFFFRERGVRGCPCLKGGDACIGRAFIIVTLREGL